MSRRRSAPVVLALLALVSAAAVGKYVYRLFSPAVAPLESAPVLAPSAFVPVPSPSVVVSPKVESRPSSQTKWKRFRAQFGEDLTAQFGRDGFLESIRGVPGSGARAGGRFSPEDPQRSIQRAREILDAANELLGLQEGYSVDSPRARTGTVSSQVFFRESLNGVPIAPQGSVTVDLGPQGELLGLYSHYVRDVEVVNSPRIGVDEAKAKAIAAIVDPNSSLPAGGGEKVIWVSQPLPGSRATRPRGNHAYEFSIQGRQVIVDAQSGEVLHRRDRRDF